MKKITKIKEPKPKALMSKAMKEVADAESAEIYNEIRRLIIKVARRGGYRVKWKIAKGLRGYRIPQAMGDRLQAEGFCVDIITNLRGNVAIGLIIVWGVL